MWQWLLTNSSALSLFISLGTLGVWLFYAHLLFAAFRRQRRARILINQGWGQQIDSVCLISNMSQEAIYIHSILLTINTPDGEYTESITEFDAAELSGSQNRANELTRQGPMQASVQLSLGTFRSLIRQIAERNEHFTPEDDLPIQQLEIEYFKITVIASYGPEGGIVGAQRKFKIRGENNEKMRPVATTTERMDHRDARRRLTDWLENEI